MKLNILGTEYELSIRDPKEDEQLTEHNDGYTDTTTKEFVVEDMSLKEGDPGMKRNLKDYEKQVIRHEIIHGFLFESGLDAPAGWPASEEIVDWFAIQLPKIAKICQEADAM